MARSICCLLISLIAVQLCAQQAITDVAENQYVKVSGRAAITPNGVKGYIKVTNTTNDEIYISGAGASVSIQKVTQTSSGEKAEWLNKTLTVARLFLGPGKAVVDNDAGSDLKSSYYNQVRNLKIYLGNVGIVSRRQPNTNCFRLKVGTTPLFTVDGLTYSAVVAAYQSSKYVGADEYSARLIVRNPSAQNLVLTAPVLYKIHYNGHGWRGEAKYKKVKANNDDTEIMESVYATSTPTIFLEITSLPSVEGVSSGDQTSKIAVPAYQETVASTPQSTSQSTYVAPTVASSVGSSSLLIDSDVEGILNVDGTDVAVVLAGQSQKLQVGPGEHIVKLTPRLDPTAVSSQVVEVKEGAQKVVLVKMMTPQFQAKVRQQALAAEQETKRKANEERLSKGVLTFIADLPVLLKLDGEFIGSSNPDKKVRFEGKTGPHKLEIQLEENQSLTTEETVVVKGGEEGVKNVIVKPKFGKAYTEAVTAKKGARDKIMSVFPRKYWHTRLWEPDDKTPYEWEIKPDEVSFDSNNGFIVGSMPCQFFGDSIITSTGKTYYQVDFANKVRSQRVNAALTGGIFSEKGQYGVGVTGWTVRTSSKDFSTLSFFKDQTGKLLSSKSRKVTGSKLEAQDFTWSIKDRSIVIVSEGETSSMEILDFFNNKALVAKADGETAIMKLEKTGY